MILSELRHYLQQHKRVALNDLVNHFDIDADALRGMLNKWIAKGYVQKTSTSSNCGTSCCKCDIAAVEFYEWQDKDSKK